MNCKYCNKKYSANKHLNNHEPHCLENPNRIPYTCIYCKKNIEEFNKFTGHMQWCEMNPRREEIMLNKKRKESGKVLSEETKKKISISRIKYLKENPDKVPYLLNHSSKISYPEETIIKYLNLYNIKGWIFQMQFSIYKLDFAFPEYKLDVEIDGATHNTEKVKKIDARRDLFLAENGWRVLRITAKEVKNNVYECINKILINFGEKQIDIPEEFLNKKYKEKVKTKSICNKCSKECSYGKTRCSDCYRIDSRKVERPSIEILLNDIKELGYCGTGRKYNVSDNAIRKWLK